MNASARDSVYANQAFPLVKEHCFDCHDSLMGDLMVLAFQLDLTRVATLLIDPERWDSPRMYHGLFNSPQNHHVLTHTKGEEAKALLAEIDRFADSTGLLQELNS